MATSVTCNPCENDDRKCLLDNYRYLTDNGCLKELPHYTPLGLRRSVSLEDISADLENNLPQKLIEQSATNLLPTHNSQLSSSTNLLLPSHNPQLSSSLNSLCFRVRRYQLLPEYDEDMAKSADLNDFNWRKTAARLIPFFERNVRLQYKQINYIPDTFLNEDEITFKKCRRQGRRNAVCLGIDRLYYNDQLILFATIASQVEFEFNLMAAGYRL